MWQHLGRSSRNMRPRSDSPWRCLRRRRGTPVPARSKRRTAPSVRADARRRGRSMVRRHPRPRARPRPVAKEPGTSATRALPARGEVDGSRLCGVGQHARAQVSRSTRAAHDARRHAMSSPHGGLHASVVQPIADRGEVWRRSRTGCRLCAARRTSARRSSTRGTPGGTAMAARLISWRSCVITDRAGEMMEARAAVTPTLRRSMTRYARAQPSPLGPLRRGLRHRSRCSPAGRRLSRGIVELGSPTRHAWF